MLHKNISRYSESNATHELSTRPRCNVRHEYVCICVCWIREWVRYTIEWDNMLSLKGLAWVVRRYAHISTLTIAGPDRNAVTAFLAVS